MSCDDNPYEDEMIWLLPTPVTAYYKQLDNQVSSDQPVVGYKVAIIYNL